MNTKTSAAIDAAAAALKSPHTTAESLIQIGRDLESAGAQLIGAAGDRIASAASLAIDAHGSAQKAIAAINALGGAKRFDYFRALATKVGPHGFTEEVENEVVAKLKTLADAPPPKVVHPLDSVRTAAPVANASIAARPAIKRVRNLTRAEFEKLPHSARNELMKAGGKLHDTEAAAITAESKYRAEVEAAKSKTRTFAQFQTMNHAERNEFIRGGGKIA